ncbi:hypothetical protein LXJ15735_27170 [Lacrimispora xylanolytica]
MKVLTQKDLLEVLPFGKTKLQKLLLSGELPVTKIGRSYVTTDEQIAEWLKKNEGKTVDF